MLITLPLENAWYINTAHVSQVKAETMPNGKHHVTIVMSDGQRIKYGPSHDFMNTAVKAAHDVVSTLNLMTSTGTLPKPGTDNPMVKPKTRVADRKPITLGPDTALTKPGS